MRVMQALVLTVALAAAGPAARAADTGSPAQAATPARAEPLAAARTLIGRSEWAGALRELRRVNAKGDADWNNLMGYALRKQAQPDLAGAQAHYDEALRLQPQHRGALEYAGELALMKGELAVAQAHLASLARACGAACEEHADLQKAIERFKANGSRYAP